MADFFSAAIPFLLTGFALAILAANWGANKKNPKKQGTHMATGGALGLLFGVMLNGCGLWENHMMGLILGVLWGMALGSHYQETEPHDWDPEQKL